MQIRNTNPSFGDAGPFEAESIDALVEDTMPTLREWAREQLDNADDASIDGDETREQWIDRRVAEMAGEFRDGLEVVD